MENLANWTISELDTYKIRIKTADTQAFFGISNLPAPTVDPVILQNVNLPRDHEVELSKDIRTFFAYLHDTTQKKQPSFVDDFTHHLLGDVLRLDEPLTDGGGARRRTPFPIIMNGQQVNVLANSVRRKDYYIIVVQKAMRSRDQVEPRLVGVALGAFCKDNETRAAKGLAPMSSKMYIGIVTIQSAHFFYKITITQAFVDAVMKSQSPAEETIVERFIPPVRDIDDFLRKGMLPLDNRRVCFQCYEALKALL